MSKKASQLELWTDQTDEGEFIALDIAEVCKQTNSQIEIYRILFTSNTEQGL